MNKKVILISSHVEPSSRVNARRLSYWSFYLAQTLEVHILTPQQDSITESPYKNIRSSITLHKINNSGALEIFLIVKILLNKKLFFNNIFVISGGPFKYFCLAPLLKLFNNKVVLDYRDPLADNLRFNDSWQRNSIKKLYQNFVNFWADRIITVNESLSSKLNSQKTIIIPNGSCNYINFDKSVKKANEKKYIIYTIGKLYCDPVRILSLLNSVINGLNFHYFGNLKESPFQIPNLSYCFSHPSLKHKELLETTSSYQTAILFAGNNHELSYTKIFDFMALNQKIIIYNDSENEDSELKIILRNYPNKIFVYPEKESTEKLESFLKQSINPYDHSTSIYDRENSSRLLLNIIQDYL